MKSEDDVDDAGPGPVVDPRALLSDVFDAALAAVSPARCLPAHLPHGVDRAVKGKSLVVGAGKAAAAMALAAEENWPTPLAGLVVTAKGYGVPCRNIEVIEAAHPVPDSASASAAERIMALAKSAGPDDQVLCLFSGGGSALLTAPAPGLTLDDKQSVTRSLLRSGAAIAEINTVRRHLSAIKGGRLATACAPARVVTLVISDVPGDDPADVASGPTVAGRTVPADAVEILGKYRIPVSENVIRHLRRPPRPEPLSHVPGETSVIAAAWDALAAAARTAEKKGLGVVNLGDTVQGEARELARRDADLVRRMVRSSGGVTAPCVILYGGEATVTVRGHGRGGPNSEYALALVAALRGMAGVFALACNTDGIDGTGDNAGAVATPDTLSRAADRGLNADNALKENDSHGFFSALGDLVVTGPTRTNVSDFRAILILPTQR